METNYDHWKPAPARDDRRWASLLPSIFCGQENVPLLSQKLERTKGAVPSQEISLGPLASARWW